MWITTNDAVVMFARHCRARFGKAARRPVRAKATALRKRGDLAGERVWTRVAEEIERNTVSPS